MGEPNRHQGSRPGERGYILALLLGICTVMVIHLQRALPNVYAEVQRELEAELIYRGEHLAKGIKIYQAKRGAYPSGLDQLVNVKPRLIRKYYKDPMTHEGDWIMVLGVQGPKSGDVTGLPVVGFHSSSPRDSFRAYHGKTIYNEWVFSAADNLLGIPGGVQDLSFGGVPKPSEEPPSSPPTGEKPTK